VVSVDGARQMSTAIMDAGGMGTKGARQRGRTLGRGGGPLHGADNGMG